MRVKSQESVRLFRIAGGSGSLVNKARPAVLHSMAFFLNSAAAWATVMSPTIAIGAIRGDYRFEQRYGRMYYAVNRHWPEVIIANSDRAWRAAEAMAAGLPVVATDVGDIRRLVAEGV